MNDARLLPVPRGLRDDWEEERMTGNRIPLACLPVLLVCAGVLPAAAETLRLGPAIEYRFDAPPPAVPGAAPARAVEDGLVVNPFDRAAVVQFYQDYFVGTDNVNAGWTGSTASCDPGTTTEAYREATRQRINFYRAMAGLPAAVAFDPTWDSMCADAALIMIAQLGLSHSPPSNWACWTQTGADAAAKSNLALGSHGPAAIRNYVYDFAGDGSSVNSRVGHRRWVLYPPLQMSGSGSTTARNQWATGSNAMWVSNSGSYGPRPESPEYVAWPPAGYVPFQLIDPNTVFFPSMTPENQRWSLSYYLANFDNAEVTMTQGGSSVPVTVVNRTSGFVIPDAVIVWEPEGLPRKTPPAQDTTYTVTVSNVLVDGSPRQFVYDVTLIDPNAAAPPTPTPTRTPPASPTPTAAGPADVNHDGWLDQADLFSLSSCWGMTSGDAGFDARCDMNGSGTVEAQDLNLWLEHWPQR